MRAVAGLVLVAGAVAAVAPACSLGEGQGDITGRLDVPQCWSGRFELHPDFFGGVPYRDSFQIRIQNGGDFETFSDGLSILVDDVHAIRGDKGPSLLGQPLAVTMPPEVTPPGVPVTPNPNPGLVHLTLYLQRTCRTQNVALYAVESAALNSEGGCDAPTDGGPTYSSACTGGASVVPPLDGGADATADASGPAPTPAAPAVGHSTLTFAHLFNNNPEETDAAKRLTEISDFTVYLADPREVCPGGLGPPPRCRGVLHGSNIKFYFERGRPGQPFP